MEIVPSMLQIAPLAYAYAYACIMKGKDLQELTVTDYSPLRECLC